ncbi:hypothetical protein [Actinoplanes sp. G11-F43]|uniref:hypothetical protein n=1 Tax=Actinoplanes sp. G11-F43 TaxID=3424130 RepID=UPI003D335E4F
MVPADTGLLSHRIIRCGPVSAPAQTNGELALNPDPRRLVTAEAVAAAERAEAIGASVWQPPARAAALAAGCPL